MYTLDCAGEVLSASLNQKGWLTVVSSESGYKATVRVYDADGQAEFLHKNGRTPEQVQDFYPTPGTLSACMYYTGIDPRDMS